MSGYEKRILYFDEIENGRKVKNAGFTKLILQGEQCRLSVNINGLHKTDTIQCDLMLLEDEKEVALSRIALQQGRCNYSCLLTREQMGRKGISLEDAYGVCVRLSEQRFLKAVWRERRAQEQSGARKNIEEQQMPEVQEIQQGQQKPEAQEVRREQGKTEAQEGQQEQRKMEVWQIQQGQQKAEVWEMPEEQGMPEVQGMPEGQGMPEEQEMPEVQEMPEKQGMPEVQGLPEERGMPEVQGLLQEQKASEVHVILENQRTPEVREMPEEPEISEVYGTPGEQKASQMRGIPEEPGMPVLPMASQEYEMSGNQNVLESRKTVKVQGIPERGEEIRQQAKRISDDKWKQLECVFPIIHPFGDKREYLSIAPKDFIVLTREYQSLANNSFLLHGFYNYHHIILGKIPIRGKELFFLGVPGVFYEREKAVAIMFGFESFECAKEPAETGTFGYYMKRVEI